MKLFGLIGYPLTHSFSRKYFMEKFEREGITDHDYLLFSIPQIDELKKILSDHPGLKGLNVTIPYKEQVIPYLDEISPVVQQVGACNCIRIEEGRLTGFNTDVIGFKRTLEPHLKPHHNKALVLGTGGAAKAVYHVLRELKIDYTRVSRTLSENAITYEMINEQLIHEHKLIINTTPLGMHPHVESAPELPYECIGADHYLYDLVYNPDPTLFLKKGMEKGATIENGSEMLVIQAEESWKIWNF
jgi:shikimate dehydrogenase